MKKHVIVYMLIWVVALAVVSSVQAIVASPADVSSADSDYFPMQEGLSWFYEATEGMDGKVVDRIKGMTRERGYQFASYNGAARTFIQSGARVFEVRVREDGSLQRRLWYDFSADVGAQWTIEPFEHTEGDRMDGTTVTVAKRNENIRTSVGTEYAGVLHFRFEPAPGLADAGLLEEWFVPDVGCVKRIVQTLAGPVVYELVGVERTEEAFPLSLELEINPKPAQVGENIGIHITVWNRSDQDEVLRFRSGLQADYIIDGIYRWSEGKMFTMALTSVTVPAGGSHTWDFVHRPEDWSLSPGIHTIIGMVVGYPLKARTQITVGPLGTILGTVTDETGQPIDVMVYAHPAAMEAGYDEEESRMRSGEMHSHEGMGRTGPSISVEIPPMPMPPVPAPWGPYRAMTDENGRFLLEYIPLNQTLLIQTYKEGYDPARTQVLVDQDTVGVALTLHQTVFGVIVGQTVDEEGHPLPEVELSAYVEPAFFEESPPGAAYDGDALAGKQEGESVSMVPLSGPILSFKGLSDMEGRFTIRDVPVGRTVALSARKRGYEPTYTRIEMSAEEVQVRLMLFRQDDRYPNLIARVRDGVRYETTIDREVYRPEDVLHMRYRVTNVDRPSITFTFSTGQQHEFVLRLPDGEEIWRWSKRRSFREAPSTLILGQGESVAFEDTLDLSTLPLNEWGFMLSGYLPVVAEEGEIQAGETEVYVKFMLKQESPVPRRAVIEGMVTEATGVPLSDVTVIAAWPASIMLRVRGSAQSEEDGEGYVAMTDENGHFVLEGLAQGGTYEVVAFKEGYEPQSQIVYAIQDRNRVHFALKPVTEEGGYNNIAHRVDDGIQYELATDRHFYGPRDTVHMRYTVTNLRETPVSFVSSNGQQFDFVLRKANRPESSLPREEVWRWSADKMFPMMIMERTLGSGESMTFEEKLDLGALTIPREGTFILSGYLTMQPNVDSEEKWTPARTEVSVELQVGDRYEVVDTGSSKGEQAAARSGLGIYVELYTPFGEIQLNGQIEFSVTFTNPLPELPSHIFLKMVDFEPGPLVKSLIRRAYVEVSYDDSLLARFGIKDEERLGLFFWDTSSEPARWNRVEGGVNAEENVVWGEVPGAAQLALFASEPTEVSEEEAALPAQFTLDQNYPNPFNPTTMIPFSVPGTGLRPDVRLVVYNALGQPVRTLAHGPMAPGTHEVVWDGRNDQGIRVSSGIYLCRLSVGARTKTRKMLLMR